ncbi:maleylpyruvate isomerase N-terminal domain-containing protein [Actinophytocola gossypii]|uniref:Maleylpyruvate isomerase N-terminal domain-containing protein n=1 Tax=Actinophytocola gossypii TaxID=2812003 RepID=A0ABT2JCV5_9PSEU|nr:maleylpyruvate isomerase N-terminal domain-containing protein [Actinophytocola gossypii]MCT2585707.1 maleylpyruvate isomerase N-terminal domain-containing protein [Actinophytocola gossypii]
MEFGGYVAEVEGQAGAFRAAAVSAGPDAPVPTCQDWTVHKLVRHLAKVYNWVCKSLVAPPESERLHPDQAPEPWDELLGWFDEQLATMVDGLRAAGPDAPAWVFDPTSASTAAFWARRQAHETAIHRLDAEHAAAGSDRADAVPSLVFEPAFAADGIDELLVLMVPRRLARELPDVEGTVLFHAADAGRAWLVELTPGGVPVIGPADEIDTDASVVGTADAVYRAAWHRPSTAITTGDRTLVDALRTP